MNELQMMVKFIVDGFVSPGSVFMWLILFIGFGILGLCGERAWFLFMKCGTSTAAFMSSISKYLKSGDFEKAIKFSSTVQTPLAKGILAVLQKQR
jgi:biopolymer transport protein ExbB/TolQ